MEIKKAVGIRLKQIRKSNNYTQQKLAEASGIDRTFISHIEKGNRNITIETIEKFTLTIGINMKSFFNSKVFE